MHTSKASQTLRSSSRLFKNAKILPKSTAFRAYHLAPANVAAYVEQPPSADFFFTSHNRRSSIQKAGESSSQHQPGNDPECEMISDQEWDLRVGRALDILQHNMPVFFRTGLLYTTADLERNLQIDNKGKGKGKAVSHSDWATEEIYSKHIRLEYTPPVALPSPFPHVLTVEGLPLYAASAVSIRHMLNALYTDLEVDMRKFLVKSDNHNGSSGSPGNTSSSSSSNPGVPSPRSLTSTKQPHSRQRSVQIRIGVLGIGRIGGTRSEWDVESTYTFSPITGLICKHTVNSIQPAPHETVFTALKNALARLHLGGAPDMGKGGIAGVQAGLQAQVEPALAARSSSSVNRRPGRSS